MIWILGVVGAFILALSLYFKFKGDEAPVEHKVETTTVTFHLAGGSVDRIFTDQVIEDYGYDDFVYSSREQAKEFIHGASHYFKLDDGSYLNKNNVHKITLQEGFKENV